MTVREIAKRAGVSPATVSRYFTGAQNISEDSAQKIRAVVQEQGAQRPVRMRRKSGVLVMAVPHMRLGFYAEVMRQFMEKVPGYGMQLVFLPIWGLGPEALTAQLKRLAPDGLILLEEDERLPVLDVAREMQLPTVICGEAVRNSQQVVTVRVNDMVAAYEGTRYLLSLGHRDIVFFANHARGINASYQRISGCSMAMTEQGLRFGEPYVRYGDLYYENGYRFANEIATGGLRFSAIFAFSDEMARGAIDALQDLGLRVPQDVSVMGFDDLSLAAQTRPRLTTIHQPIDEFVQCTVDMFFNEDFSMRSREIVMPHRIVERDSCAPKEKSGQEG